MRYVTAFSEYLESRVGGRIYEYEENRLTEEPVARIIIRPVGGSQGENPRSGAGTANLSLACYGADWKSAADLARRVTTALRDETDAFTAADGTRIMPSAIDGLPEQADEQFLFTMGVSVLYQEAA